MRNEYNINELNPRENPYADFLRAERGISNETGDDAQEPSALNVNSCACGYVIADIEWLQQKDGTKSPTQLAAIRVDENYNILDRFSVLCCPDVSAWVKGSEVALTGYTMDEFNTAGSTAQCMSEFAAWLRSGDIVLVWHFSAKTILSQLWKKVFAQKMPYKITCIFERIQTAVSPRGISSGGLYPISRALGMNPAIPEHCSVNDVRTLHELLVHLQISPKQLLDQEYWGREDGSNATGSRINGSVLKKSARKHHKFDPSCNYCYVPGSDVFHRTNCKIAHRANDLRGCITYKTASRDRRPCKICCPEPPFSVELPESKFDEDRQGIISNGDKKAELSVLKPSEDAVRLMNEVIRTTLLDKSVVDIKRKNIVGRCFYDLHPGLMTKALLIQHDCIGKQCRFLQKFPEATYWKGIEQKKIRRDKIKAIKASRKSSKQTRAEIESSLCAAFREYAAELGCPIDVVRVQIEQNGYKKLYRILFVSDNPFADGNLYPSFFSRIKQQCPGVAILMRHVRDVDGHFVTRAEYAARKNGW